MHPTPLQILCFILKITWICQNYLELGRKKCFYIWHDLSIVSVHELLFSRQTIAVPCSTGAEMCPREALYRSNVSESDHRKPFRCCLPILLTWLSKVTASKWFISYAEFLQCQAENILPLKLEISDCIGPCNGSGLYFFNMQIFHRLSSSTPSLPSKG